MKYNYDDIRDLEQLKDILIKKMNEYHNNKKVVDMIISYLGEIIDMILDDREDINGCNQIIEEVINYLNDIDKQMTCPMCQEEKMKHIEYNGTHIYICEHCPFIGFEYVEQKDIDNLKEYLEREKK